MPAGRPTLYKPEYCNLVVEKQSQGWSLAEFAFHVGVARSTVDQWGVDNPEFSEALTRAKAAEQSWWERAGREGMLADKFNAVVWKTSMAARFREDYTERKQTELSGSIGIHEAALSELE